MSTNQHPEDAWDALYEAAVARDDSTEALVAGLEAGKSFAVVGARGMGKSTLTRAVLHRRLSSNLSGPIPLLIRIKGSELSPEDIVERIRCQLASCLTDRIDRPYEDL